MQELLRLPQLADWLTERQMANQGGFQGRTNKLVDGCYSFWQGAVPALLIEGTGESAGAELRLSRRPRGRRTDAGSGASVTQLELLSRPETVRSAHGMETVTAFVTGSRSVGEM